MNENLSDCGGVKIPVDRVTLKPWDDSPSAIAEIKEAKNDLPCESWQKVPEPTDFNDLVSHRKIAYVSPEELMEYFGNWQGREYITLREFEEAEGARVIGVFYDHVMRRFGIELARMDWPYVAPDTEAPKLNHLGSQSRMVKIVQ